MKKQGSKKPLCSRVILEKLGWTPNLALESGFSITKDFVCLLTFLLFFLGFLHTFSKYSSSYINVLDVSSMGKIQEWRNFTVLAFVNVASGCLISGRMLWSRDAGALNLSDSLRSNLSSLHSSWGSPSSCTIPDYSQHRRRVHQTKCIEENPSHLIPSGNKASLSEQLIHLHSQTL